MGLPLPLLYLMRPALAELARLRPQARVLGLGYPDIIDGRDALCALFGEDIRDGLTTRDDAQQVAKRHGAAGTDLVEPRSLFTALGLQLECIDMCRGRGIDRVVDLNQPLPEDLAGRYAMVIDPGTIEHCFNIGQAMINVMRALAVGGFVVHVNPLSMFNHGFYNLNPTFYHDFYGDNGIQVLFMNGFAGHAFFDVAAVQRFQNVPENAVMLVIARRIAERPLVWPVQSKYRNAAGSAA